MSTSLKIYGVLGLIGGIFTLAVYKSTTLQNYLGNLATNLAVKALDTIVTVDDEDDDGSSEAKAPPKEILVGVGVIVKKGTQVLIGRRLNSKGASTYAVPGGRLEYGESFLYRGLEELYEETGIRISHPDLSKSPDIFPPYAPDPGILPESKLSGDENTQDLPFEGGFQNILCPLENCQLLVRYVICNMPGDQEPQRMEPEKCEGWFWVEWQDLVQIARRNEKLYSQRKIAAEQPTPVSSTLGTADEKSASSDSDQQDKSKDKQDIAPPCYTCASQGTDGCPTCSPEDYDMTPTAPDLTEAMEPGAAMGLPLLPGRDTLFAPLHYLLLSNFDPFNVKPT